MIKVPTLQMLIRSGFKVVSQNEQLNRMHLVPKVPDHPSGVGNIDFYPENKIYFFDENMLYHNFLGPSLISNNLVEYRKRGELHRYDGPAKTWKLHWERQEWIIHGSSVYEVTYLEWLDEMGMDIKNLTPEDKVLIDLKWKP